MPRQLTESQVRSFQETSVWQEITKQLESDKNRYLVEAIDNGSERSAGAYRAVEMVLGLPARFIVEISKEENGNRSVLNFSRLGPKKG